MKSMTIDYDRISDQLSKKSDGGFIHMREVLDIIKESTVSLKKPVLEIDGVKYNATLFQPEISNLVLYKNTIWKLVSYSTEKYTLRSLQPSQEQILIPKTETILAVEFFK